MSGINLSEIEARLKAITPGEWGFDFIENAVYTTIDGEEYTVCIFESGAEYADGSHIHGDILFVLQAPGDIKALLSEVERLRAALFNIHGVAALAEPANTSAWKIRRMAYLALHPSDTSEALKSDRGEE